VRSEKKNPMNSNPAIVHLVAFLNGKVVEDCVREGYAMLKEEYEGLLPNIPVTSPAR
jgi:hypothetical protein